MQHAILVRHLGIRRPAAVVQNLLYAARRVRIQHEDLPEVCVRRLQQVQPIALRLRERVLMPEHYLFGVIVQLAQRNKSAPLLHRTRPWHLEPLRIGKHARHMLLRQHTLLAPCLQVPRRACVYAFSSLSIEKLRQTQNDAHKIVGATLVIGLLHRRGDLVVRLRHNVFEPDSGRIVAPGAKWIDGRQSGSCSALKGLDLRRPPHLCFAGKRPAHRLDCIAVTYRPSRRLIYWLRVDKPMTPP